MLPSESNRIKKLCTDKLDTKKVGEYTVNMETRKTVLITLVTIIIIVITFKYIQFTNSRDEELMKINYCLDYQDVPQVCE